MTTKTTCSIEECERPRHGKTWCQMHYRRNLYRSSPTAPNLNADPEATFWRKVDKHGPLPEHREDLGPCWLWEAGISKRGYAKWKPPRTFPIQTYIAHRVSFFLINGPIPVDRPQLDHLCRVRRCVNPDHLEPVTLAENLKRGFAAITHCPAGHLYDEQNTYWATVGGYQCRSCRSCHRLNEARRRKEMAGREGTDVRSHARSRLRPST